MAQQSNLSFDILAEMHAFAKKSMEEARVAFDRFISAAQTAASTADRRASGTRASVKELGAFDFAQRLVGAAG